MSTSVPITGNEDKLILKGQRSVVVFPLLYKPVIYLRHDLGQRLSLRNDQCMQGGSNSMEKFIEKLCIVLVDELIINFRCDP